jgi:hypothetical protein
MLLRAVSGNSQPKTRDADTGDNDSECPRSVFSMDLLRRPGRMAPFNSSTLPARYGGIDVPWRSRRPAVAEPLTMRNYAALSES